MESSGGLTNTYADVEEDVLSSVKAQLSEEQSIANNQIQETEFTEIAVETMGETVENETEENLN
jgi:hypothetical protein